jgi:hypothetical protein
VTQGENEYETANESEDLIETLPVLLMCMDDDDDDDDDDKEEEMMGVTAAVIGMGVVIPLRVN